MPAVTPVAFDPGATLTPPDQEGEVPLPSPAGDVPVFSRRGQKRASEDEPGPAQPSWWQAHREEMLRAPTAKVPRRTGRQPVERRAGIGPRPEGCTKEVWQELERLHIGMGHVSNTGLCRMLARHGVRSEVLGFASQILCSVCIELSRPAADPQSGSASVVAKRFRDVVAIDEFFVTLTDGLKVTVILMMDMASRLAVTWPLTRVTSAVTSEDIIEALERGWISWAGVMRSLRANSAKSHISAAVENF